MEILRGPDLPFGEFLKCQVELKEFYKKISSNYVVLGPLRPLFSVLKSDFNN